MPEDTNGETKKSKKGGKISTPNMHSTICMQGGAGKERERNGMGGQ